MTSKTVARGSKGRRKSWEQRLVESYWREVQEQMEAEAEQCDECDAVLAELWEQEDEDWREYLNGLDRETVEVC